MVSPQRGTFFSKNRLFLSSTKLLWANTRPFPGDCIDDNGRNWRWLDDAFGSEGWRIHAERRIQVVAHPSRKLATVFMHRTPNSGNISDETDTCAHENRHVTMVQNREKTQKKAIQSFTLPWAQEWAKWASKQMSECSGANEWVSGVNEQAP